LIQYLSGEDPYLGSQLAGPAVAGLQRNKVIANAKHYVDNSQEIGRWTQTEVVDERSQWELYYPPFKGAVDAGLHSIMCSYVTALPPQPASQPASQPVELVAPPDLAQYDVAGETICI
jgi:beta-glucosidase-like glycosyl hydrolase